MSVDLPVEWDWDESEVGKRPAEHPRDIYCTSRRLVPTFRAKLSESLRQFPLSTPNGIRCNFRYVQRNNPIESEESIEQFNRFYCVSVFLIQPYCGTVGRIQTF